MDPTTAQFKRFWEPSYFQAIGLSLFAGAVATAITHPIDFVKTIIQFRAEGVGLRGYKCNLQSYLSSLPRLQSQQGIQTNARHGRRYGRILQRIRSQSYQQTQLSNNKKHLVQNHLR